MNQRNIPADPQAEAALIGAALLSKDVVYQARWLLDAGDFYVPNHQRVWAVMADLAHYGKQVDVITVTAECGGTADIREMLLACQNATPSVSRWMTYVDIVVKHAASRQLIVLAADATERAFTGGDPWEAAAELAGGIGGIGRQAIAPPSDLRTADAFADLPDDIMPPALVPGLLRIGDRVIEVAEEGVGKSVLNAQIATMVAQGINPFWPAARFPPCSTLVIDLENPAYVIRSRFDGMRTAIQRHSGQEYHEGLCHVWHRRAGIDLRSRQTQRELDAVLAETQPSLVILSPLYKAIRKRAREDQEDVAAEVQTVLDDFIARYQFALIIEHHAPKGSVIRDMVPFGSSLWLRWPEYGLALAKEGPDSKLISVGRFRGDRVRNPGWPSHLQYGTTWPWSASWVDAHPWMPGSEFL